MKNKLLTSVAALTLVVMAGKFFAVPLLAQVRAALVQNVDERGRIPYQSTVNADCPLLGKCAAYFGAVPSNKRLVITHFDLNTSVDNFGKLWNIILFNQSGLNQVNPEFTGTVGNAGVTFYSSSRDVQFYLDAGDVPAVLLDATNSLGDGLRSVSLSGYLLDCTSGCAAIVH